MKPTHLLLSLLTALLVAPFLSGPARAADLTVQVIATFDYPGATSTQPFAINDSNQIAGVITTGATTSGFTREPNGQFSAPIVDPDDAHAVTVAFGINNSGTVCGYYFGSKDYHGFFFSNATYTTYDVPGETGTKVTGINEAGDFVGVYFDPVVDQQGFISVGGAVTPINIPGGTYITAQDLNARNQVVGMYSDGQTGEGYAFYSDRQGELQYPINAPQAKNTFFNGINDQGYIVGGFADGGGHNRATHGLLFIPPSEFVTVDYAGSSDVVLTGINQKGIICGYYTDNTGKVRGLVARARRTAE